MLTAKEFRRRWSGHMDQLIPFPRSLLLQTQLRSSDIDFLVEAGLPFGAAPCLSFGPPKQGPIPTAAAEWRLSEEFARFLVIGSDGSGSPICLDDRRHGEVVLLDHDAKFARQFVNSSVVHLAESLLAYRRVVEETQRRHGEDAFINGDIPADLAARFRDDVSAADPPAIEPEAFWYSEYRALTND